MSQANASSYQKWFGYHAILLGLAVLLASAALVFVNLRTRDEIATRMQEDLKASLQQVVPANLYDNEILNDTIDIKAKDVTGQMVTITFYRARMKGKIVALAFPATGYGYSGAISMIIGIDTNGTLLGVRIIAHAETPGLGDKIETGKSKWILGFNGLSLENPPRSKWAVKKDGGNFDSFTGATITPRAVVAAIRNGLDTYSMHRTEILKVAMRTGNESNGSATEKKGNNNAK